MFVVSITQPRLSVLCALFSKIVLSDTATAEVSTVVELFRKLLITVPVTFPIKAANGTDCHLFSATSCSHQP